MGIEPGKLLPGRRSRADHQRGIRASRTGLKLTVKVSLFGAGIALIAMATIVSLAMWQSGRYNNLAQAEVNGLIDADLDHITQGIYSIVQTENEAIQQQLDTNLDLALRRLAGLGGASLDAHSVSWAAVNQLSGEKTTIRLPRMLVGGRWLGNNPDPAVETPVVDEVTRLAGESATVFQRMNPSGDMLLAATTAKTVEGLRALGTCMPAINPDGSANPLVQSVLRGERYNGPAYLVNAYYLTACQAIRDAEGTIVGMLSVGVKLANVEPRVRQAILRTRVGKTGYVYVLAGTGEERGRYIISQSGERDGENIWASTDSDGRPVIQEIVRKAVALKSGELATERYPWRNTSEGTPRWKVVRLAYFEPWNWVIGVSAYEDELQGYRIILNDGRKRMMVFMGAAGSAITAFIWLLGSFLAWTIVRPVRRLTAAAETIAGGTFDGTVDVSSRDEIGALARTFNIMTERLRSTTESLVAEKERLSVTLRSIGDGVITTDVAGKVVLMNKLAESLTGWEAARAAGRSIGEVFSIVNAASREPCEDPIDKVLRSGTVVGLANHTVLVARDGRERVIADSGAPIRDDTGRVIGVVLVFRDITLMEKQEKELLKAEKLQALSLLAGGIAHDFNNMLTAILGNVSIAAAELPKNTPMYECLLEAEKASIRAKDLARQLLTFAKGGEPVKKLCDAGGVIREAAGFACHGAAVSCRCEIARDLLPLEADSGQLGQVIQNMVINSVQAMPSGGTITITAENVTLAADNRFVLAAGPYLKVSICDDGEGIPEDVLPKIFDPYFTTKQGGSGLGLSTCYSIIDNHLGHIEVFSTLGAGSTFETYLPASSGRHPPQTDERPVESTPRGKRILVMDDEEPVRKMMKKMLGVLGFEADIAPEGGAAIELYQNAKLAGCPFDAVIMDLTVAGGIGGEEAIRLLQELDPSVKVIVSSGYSNSSTVARYREHGFRGALAKPYGLNNLKNVLGEVLNE